MLNLVLKKFCFDSFVRFGGRESGSVLLSVGQGEGFATLKQSKYISLSGFLI